MRKPLTERKSRGKISEKIKTGEKEVIRKKCPSCYHHKAWKSITSDVIRCTRCGGIE